MAKTGVVMIRAIIERASPERIQFKPYSTSLTFDGKVEVEIPVPAEHVRKEGDRVILSLAGWMIFLDTYSIEADKMHSNYIRSFQQPGQQRPYNPNIT